MIGPFRGINQEATLPLQRGFQLLWRPQLAIGHQIELDQGVVQNRRELMEVFVGFRPCHLELCPQDIKGWIDLIIIEEEQELVCYRREFAFAAPSRFTPACSGLDPFFIGFLLAYQVHVTEGEQQRVELSLGQTGQGLHLAIVSDVQTHWWAPSMVFLRIAYLIFYYGTTLRFSFRRIPTVLEECIKGLGNG